MIPFPKRFALTIAVATAGAVAIPATAGAVVTPTVDGTTLTVTSNDDADTITLGVAGGVLTVNGAPTTLAANDNAQIAIEAGGGNDTVDATGLAAANYRDLVINGGEGDDLLIGGSDNDHLDGDGGDDRLIGFRGGDQVAGDLGNDTMVWNNGDGTDVNDGDAGNDEVEVNGAPTLRDQLTVRPSDQPGRVQFNRTNLNQFGIDLSAERLTVNALGGDDSFGPAAPAGLAGLVSLTVNGGSGPDNLVGGDGADLVNGGDGNDTVIGGAGDDRLVGDRGGDIHVGAEGDDVLVWNNGDGSDSLSGDDGFDRAEVNGAAAGDVFTLAPEGQNARFQRTNLVPFTLDVLADTEAITVDGASGNDMLTVAPGLARMSVSATGGSGGDTLTGGEEDDSFLGGSGNDGLTPGLGNDLADGGVGDDELFARDEAGDLVRGGAGEDEAQTDAVDVDVVSGVEQLDATPPEDDTAALAPELGEVEVLRRDGDLVADVAVRCPAAETGGCDTVLRLETARAIGLGDGVRAVVVLGSARIDLGPGQEETVRVRLAPGTGRLADDGRLAARARITSSDDAGNVVTESVRVDLRIPRN